MIHPIIISNKNRSEDKTKLSPYQLYFKFGGSLTGAPGGNWSYPLRRNIDYNSIARKCFVVDQLPPGALPSYDRDIDVYSALLEERKKFKHDIIRINSRNRIFKKDGSKFIFPQFEIFQNPMIRISDVKSRRFDLIDRARDVARQQIMSQEDDAIFKALDNILPDKEEE